MSKTDTRGRDATNRECPNCRSAAHTKQLDETPRQSAGVLVERRYVCETPSGCGYTWTVDAYGGF
ncbi:hypothetical protein BRD04_00325 [Halobacteriales archaeon QS_9_67_17]|nr:MAG: hypothetical protein BRD04_00325 [Halobacteriales archaeon QS_9_67_17]